MEMIISRDLRGIIGKFQSLLSNTSLWMTDEPNHTIDDLEDRRG